MGDSISDDSSALDRSVYKETMENTCLVQQFTETCYNLETETIPDRTNSPECIYMFLFDRHSYFLV